MAVIRDRYALDIDIGGAVSSLGNLKTAVTAAIGAFAVNEVINFGRAIIDNTRQFEQYNNQLRLITANQDDLSNTFNRLVVSARNNRAELGDTIDLYTKLSLSTESLGKTQDQVLAVTEKFQQALAISGADANTASAAIRQFGQAMASGTVRGDEFVSIVEALGPALAIMARESGKTVGELRQLSQTGLLSADVFFDMIAASEELTAAFSSMEITTSQLETRTLTTFNLIIAKMDEAIGITESYRNALRETDRFFGNLFNENNPLENLSNQEIFDQATSGVLAVDDALFELQKRLEEMPGLFIPGLGFVTNNENIQALMDLRNALIEYQQQARETAEAARAEVEAERQIAAARTEALRPIQDLINRNEEYAAANERGRSSLDRLRESQSQVLADIDRLNELRGTEIEQYIDLDALIDAATLRNDQLRESILRLSGATGNRTETFDQYYNSLIQSSTNAVREVENATLAIGRLNDDLAARRISVDQYAQAIEILNQTLGITDDTARDAQRAIDALNAATEASESYLENLNRRTEDAAFRLESLNMNPLQRQIAQIERDLSRGLNDQIADLNRQLEAGADANAIQQQIQRITAATQTAIREQQRIAEQSYESQRSFEFGWAEAFENYQESATNAAEAAGRIFETVTRGMEDSIVNFAKTGKFEFKDFLATVAEEILRSNIRRLIAQTFGGIGGGSFQNPFAGFFANGGTIPAGQFGVVGEAGPEFVSGPATVTPMSGMGSTVNYYINAVDAPSFRALVARDPGFIHAVAQQGAKTVPGRRR